MVEGIPGSSPSWRGANMKTKGRCQPTDVPESRLGGSATGLAAWGTGSPDAQRQTRRHFHQSQLTQTTAWDCLPCVDAHKQTVTVTGTTSLPSQDQEATSLSLALGNRQWRRHRREVPAPPCAEKPQGKRMLKTAPPSTCRELLQDPPEPPSTGAQQGPCDTPASAAAAVPAGIRRQTSRSQGSVALCLGMDTVQAAAAASTGRSSWSRAAVAGSAAASPPWAGASRQASKSRACDSSVALCMGLDAVQPAAAVSHNSNGTAVGSSTSLDKSTAVNTAAIVSYNSSSTAAAASGSSSTSRTAAGDTGSSRRWTGVCQGDTGSSAGASAGASGQECGQPGTASSTTGSSQRPSSQAGALSNTSSSSMQPAAAASGKAAPAHAKKKAGRVEDNPNFFRTPKDPPTLQRFADSFAQLSLGKGRGQARPAQRHAAGISARQQAQVAAAAREVAALDAAAQHDAD